MHRAPISTGSSRRAARRGWAYAAIIAALLLAGRPAWGQQPDEQSQGEQGKSEQGNPGRLEVGGLPAINYDSDRGLGVGLLVNLARFQAGYEPYRWRLQALLYASLKSAPDGGTEIGVHDDYVDLDMPGLAGDRVRLRLITGIRRFIGNGYYGPGSAAPALDPWEAIDPDMDPEGYQQARRFHQYDRIYPYATLLTRLRVWDASAGARRRRLDVFAGPTVGYSMINLYEGSLLAEHVRRSREEDSEDARTLARLVRGTDDHAVLQLNLGVLWDTRDHEYAPSRGSFTELAVRAAPGFEQDLHYAGLSLITRWFWPLYGDRAVLAVRAVGDWLLGNAPLYELSRFGAFEPIDGPGGTGSVRGVLRQRFHGKGKVIGNLELRVRLLPFRIGNNRFALGGVLFADAGRVWADHGDDTLDGVPLDGGLGDFAMGAGAGLRLQWGETFVVRLDRGWSMTEDTSGFYIQVGHVF